MIKMLLHFLFGKHPLCMACVRPVRRGVTIPGGVIHDRCLARR